MTARKLQPHQALAPLLIAFLLLARPYEGLERDDVLYFGQVLKLALLPQLGADPFFAGGSQGDFSIYARLVEPLYALIGSGATHMALLLICWGASWIALGLWLVQMGVTAPGLRLFGLLAVAVAAPFYGGLRMFGLLEPFLTARSLAEPLVLASLVLLAREHLAAGLAWQLAAAAIHPLMALPALTATWLLASWRDRRWLWMLLAIPAALVLAPERTLARYEGDWWRLVTQFNVQVVPSNWPLVDWLTALTDAAMVALAAALLPNGPGRRLLGALLAGAAGLLAANCVGTDLLHAVLITQLQPWRALGLIHLSALVLAPFVVWNVWQRGGLSRVHAAFLALAMTSSHAGSPYGAPILLGCLLSGGIAHWNKPVSRSVVWLGVGACALGIAALSLSHASLLLERLHWHPADNDAVARLSRIVTEPLVAFVVTGVLMRLMVRPGLWRTTTLTLGLAVLAGSMMSWDRRDALARAIEAPPAEPPFRLVVPPTATVYWPEHLAAVWGLLQRVSHYDPQQRAGMLFNRATAELMGPRTDAYRNITADREKCRVGAWLSRGSAQDLAACDTPAMARLRELCRGPIHPDYLVFGRPLPPAALSTWRIGHDQYHLYACTQFAPTETP